MQQATNLDALLRPTQSTRNPQMIVRLNRSIVNTRCARAVLDHIRGRILSTTFTDFVVEHHIAEDSIAFALNPDAMNRAGRHGGGGIPFFFF